MLFGNLMACFCKRHIFSNHWTLWMLLLTAASGPAASAGTKTWDGSGIPVSVNWMSSANWVGNVAPVTGDDLVFPAGAGRASNNNDYPALTIFNSITISSNNYSISGNTIALNDGISSAFLSGTSTFGPALSLRSNQTFSVGSRFGTGRFGQ